ncbi:MAG TPA: sensor histidine kinase [Burkholderiaceae bacterium]|nr:sensor histidine kinase [Burkholderiaceae bacterium]
MKLQGRRRSAFTRTDELVALAAHLQRSREDERARLARELHDELGASLTAARLDLLYLDSKLEQSDPLVREKLAALRAVLDHAIALKRRLIEDLRPSTLTHLGLAAALENLAETHRARFGGAVSTDIAGDLVLDEELALVLFRVAQESLTNVLKHADARHVRLTLRRVRRRLELRIDDDGRGFDVARTQPGCHGLLGMRHRLLSIRGSLRVESQPGRGTAVIASVPLAAARARSERDTLRPPPRRAQRGAALQRESRSGGGSRTHPVALATSAPNSMICDEK